MNNKGFISTSVIYAFFIIFLLLLVFIVDGLVSNRILLRNSRNTVIEKINNDNLEIVSNKDKPTINSINVVSKNYNSIKVKVIASQSINSEGLNPTFKYYFKKTGDSAWSNANSNEFTFTGLNSNTTYTLYAKVEQIIDNKKTTTESSIDEITNNFISASITNVTASPGIDSAILRVTAKAGSETISSYEYKKSGASSFINNGSSSTINISSLDFDTNYTYIVRVKDNSGKYSNEYTVQFKTTGLDASNVSYSNPTYTTCKNLKCALDELLAAQIK